MEPNAGLPELPSLEERIRGANAERSVGAGYAIGDALGALWRVLGSFPFSPSASSPGKRGRLMRAHRWVAKRASSERQRP